MRGLDYEVLASLDADITFEPGYFEFLLAKLAADETLGLVGTPYRDTTSEMYDYRFMSTDHVSGACQVFRRRCFDEIGGYVAAKGGAIDTIAALTARSKGWKTRTFTERISEHHRVIGTAEKGQIRSRFELGKRDWAIGNHPLWEVIRGIYQMTKRPWAVRGLAILAGYMWAATSAAERPVGKELRAFRRKEQMQQLARLLRGEKERGEAAEARRHEHPRQAAG
jgi:hypothetical protein